MKIGELERGCEARMVEQGGSIGGKAATGEEGKISLASSNIRYSEK